MDEKDKKRLLTNSGIKGNVRYITITDNVSSHWEDIIKIAKENYSWWAYIYHDKDDTEKHLHILCYDKGGTTLKSHCDRFSSVIPSHMVCKVFNSRAMARYLIHKDSPEKHSYLSSEVITNNVDKLEGFLSDDTRDVMEEFRDFCAVKNGKMSPVVFLEKYRGQVSQLPFVSKISVYHKIWDIPYRDNNNNNNKEDYGKSRTL